MCIRDRSGLARVPRSFRAQRCDVRRTRSPVRVPASRPALLRQHRHITDRAPLGCASACGGGRRRCRARVGAPGEGRGGRRRSTARSGSRAPRDRLGAGPERQPRRCHRSRGSRRRAPPGERHPPRARLGTARGRRWRGGRRCPVPLAAVARGRAHGVAVPACLPVVVVAQRSDQRDNGAVNLAGHGRLSRATFEETPVTHIVDELAWRGLVAQTTEPAALRAALDAGPVSLYCGFDPTAPSLHIGNLVQILTVRRLQLAGHKPYALVGGATGLIGDPKMTGERTLNDPEVVAGWVDRIRRQIEPLLDFDGPAAATMVNNLDWTAPLSAIDFLRDVGRHYRLGTMLAKDTVARRLNSDQGISFTEFSYQILQGMDFLELHRRYGVSLQTDGNDQWGNLLSGVELVRKVEGVGVHA